jgi:uncharacterized membrane protein (DUF106 family)
MTALLALTTPMPVQAIVLLVTVGLAYVVLSVLIQRKLTNPKRMRELQRRIQEISKEMNELTKNKAPQEEVAAKQKELMPLMGENMKASMKPMFALLPVFLLLYYVLLPSAFGSWAGHDYIFLIGMKLGYLGVFFATVFILGMASTAVIMVYDRKKAKEEKSMAVEVGQGQ